MSHEFQLFFFILVFLKREMLKNSVALEQGNTASLPNLSLEGEPRNHQSLSTKNLKHLVCLLASSSSLRLISLCEMCSNTEYFLVRIFSHSDWIRSISPYSVRMRENTDAFHAVFVKIIIINWFTIIQN